jgi:hypothetical protein
MRRSSSPMPDRVQLLVTVDPQYGIHWLVKQI